MFGKKVTCSVITLLLSSSLFANTHEGFKPEGIEGIRRIEGNESNNKVLIGSEGREESDTTRYPFTAIGYVNFRDGEDTYGCTGSMVSSNVVLTNGHCVFDQEKNKFYTDFKFFPGYQTSPSLLGEIAVKKVYVSTSYQKKKPISIMDFSFSINMLGIKPDGSA